ncbi:MAG: bifunctional hydroxymethylpyrimidine kinase/phosphomethylpyrimidine kinase, partial [Promethearchaeota archaeon]
NAREAAQEIHNQGAQNVMIKGGHLPNIQNAIDLLYDGSNFIEFHAPRINTKSTHGTGCTFASAIAAELAKENDVKSAVHIAKAYLTAAIQKAEDLRIGMGHGPTNHSQGKLVEVDLSLVEVK